MEVRRSAKPEGAKLKHRLIFVEEGKALDAQTNLQHEKYSFADAADIERVGEKFQVTFSTDKPLLMRERRQILQAEAPDEYGFNEEEEGI
jgi:hypothetical protein